MKGTRVIMGMPVTLDIVGGDTETLEKIFDFFTSVDERFSTYKASSEISAINRHEISPGDYSDDMREILRLSQATKIETEGYFDIQTPAGKIDPSGIVKGWAINKAAEMLKAGGDKNFWVEAGGDIQVFGTNSSGNAWRVGIRSPFNSDEIVKVITLNDEGIATSGDYIRGRHIYDPHLKKPALSELASITVVGANVYEADRFATAAYAMGEKGIDFIERIKGLEAYAIMRDGIEISTSGLDKYLTESTNKLYAVHR